jgi:hypothetical protein
MPKGSHLQGGCLAKGLIAFLEGENYIFYGGMKIVMSPNRGLYGPASDAERAMVTALASRFPTDPGIENYGPWHDGFAEAMRPVHAHFPEDLGSRSNATLP